MRVCCVEVKVLLLTVATTAILLLGSSVSAAAPKSPVYLLLEEGKQRCFLSEIPKDTLVLSNYHSVSEGSGNDAEPLTGLGIKVVVTDPEGNPFMSREMNPSGRFAFNSPVGGEYKLCFQTNTSRWFGRQKTKFFLDIQTGEGATDYGELAKQEHLSALEVSVRRLNDRIRDIRAEQSYQRNREIAFRDTSENTNGRVMWWSIIQTLILIGTGLWQISHLRTFFKTKKLV